MASVIEDAETYQQSGLIVPPYSPDGESDLVPLINPASPSDVNSVRRRSSSIGTISRRLFLYWLFVSTTVLFKIFFCFPAGTGTLSTIFLIVNAALGAGLLNFPKAFDQAGGVEVALIMQLFLVIFVVISLLILAKCSDANGAATVQVYIIY